MTSAARDHSEGHVDCGACTISMNMLLMIGQDGLESLWDDVGKVQEGVTFEQALTILD